VAKQDDLDSSLDMNPSSYLLPTHETPPKTTPEREKRKQREKQMRV
jgi:hypothetical protein